jgi:molybdate transport system regulatory protein
VPFVLFVVRFLPTTDTKITKRFLAWSSVGLGARRFVMPRIHPGPRKHSEAAEAEPLPRVWEGRLRLWVAVNGHNALGPGKVRLLEAIQATKSLAAAAKSLRMSYRLAWQHIQIIEERTGFHVVERIRGGRGGGGASLTRHGHELLDAYHAFRHEIEEHMRSASHRYFSKWSYVPPADHPAPAPGTDSSSPHSETRP